MHTLWLLQMSAPPCSRASDRAFAWMRAKRKRSACCWFDQQGMYCASPASTRIVSPTAWRRTCSRMTPGRMTITSLPPQAHQRCDGGQQT